MKWKKINESVDEDRSDELVGNIYDSLKTYIENLLYGNIRKNKGNILYYKERFNDAMKQLEKECGLIKTNESAEPDDTVYYYKIECEHDGDIRHEEIELEEAGAEVVDVETEGEGMDRDYWATIYFKVHDWERFQKETGCGPEDCLVKDW